MEDPVFQKPEDFPGKMLTAALPDPVRNGFLGISAMGLRRIMAVMLPSTGGT
jgi:hypothetical protein